jgi:hypothetical protein
MPGEGIRYGDSVDQDVRGGVVSVSDEPTLGDLFSSLTGDISTLIRQEVDLARTETTEKLTRATSSVISMVAGGMIAYTGLIALIIAVIVGLSNLMPLWLSALIVGIVVIAIGGIMIASGRSSLANMSVVPEKTVESMKENREWAKEQVQ